MKAFEPSRWVPMLVVKLTWSYLRALEGAARATQGSSQSGSNGILISVCLRSKHKAK